MDIVNFAQENWSVIAQAPWAFALCAVLFLGLGLGISALVNSGAHSAKDERLALAEARVADYKEKLEGRSPDEAKAQLDQLQEVVDAIASYGLSREAAQRMLAALRRSPAKVVISRVLDAFDADRLHKQVLALFREAGWTVDQITVWQVTDPPDSGVIMLTWDDTPEEVTKAVREAFDVGGLDIVQRHNGKGTSPLPYPQIVFSSRDPNYQPKARWG